MKPRALAILVLLALLLPGPVLAAATIYVPDDHTTIQDAIDAANPGDTIIVRANTYTGPKNKNLNFNGTDLTLRSESGAASTIIDCENSGRGFYFGNGETSASVVDGFTIRNGSIGSGGAISCVSSHPTIRNCVISGNWSSGGGGGIYCSSSNATIRDCTITGNSTTSDGGGIYCHSPSSPTIIDCTISGNDASAWGGGIYCASSSTPNITACTISGNSAGISGGGIWCQSSNATIANCAIRGNTASDGGGGIACLQSDPEITNCTITGNSTSDALSDGGGIRCSQSNPTITNCTISGNRAQDSGGGIACSDASNATLFNCILWDDTSPEVLAADTSVATLSYCDVEGGWGVGGPNINADPLFFDAGHWDGNTWVEGNYHLLPGSPCIDSGYGDSGATVPMTDKSGDPRYDDPGTSNTGAGTPDYVDMGAYERQPVSDVLWRNSVSGTVYIWFMNGLTISSQGVAGTLPIAWNWQIQGVGDFDGDGNSDVLWRNSVSGAVYIWFMDGLTISSQGAAGPSSVALTWQIKGVGDFDGDGNDDIMWRDSVSGAVYVWFMNGLTISSEGVAGPSSVASDWIIRGVGDVDGDGNDDIVWRRNVLGTVYIWFMNGLTISSQGVAGPSTIASSWGIEGVGDYDGDGNDDILWRNCGTGMVYIWIMNGLTISSQGVAGTVPISWNWDIKGVGDFNGDGTDDIVWRNSFSGMTYIWFMNGVTVWSKGPSGTLLIGWNWAIKGIGGFNDY